MKSAFDKSVSLLLENVQSPINIGKIFRIAENYQLGLSIYDPANVIHASDHMSVIKDFSCGASGRIDYNVVNDLRYYLKNNVGRIIVSCLCGEAERLHEFRFKPNDLIVLGNEYDGISNEVISASDKKIYIELPKATLYKPPTRNPIDPLREKKVNRNGTPCLNVAVAAGIISYQIYTQNTLGRSKFIS